MLSKYLVCLTKETYLIHLANIFSLYKLYAFPPSQIQKAYDKCFGQDYSFDDLADTVGRDSDNDDLPDEYEGDNPTKYQMFDQEMNEDDPTKCQCLIRK